MTGVPERVVVIVPGCPDRLLAPNRRAHGRAKAEPTAKHRRDAYYASLDVFPLPQLDWPLFRGPGAVTLLVRWGKGERVHDLDSVAVMGKPFLDGVVDAGILANDNQMKRLTVEQERDGTGKGEVILTISPMDQEAP